MNISFSTRNVTSGVQPQFETHETDNENHSITSATICIDGQVSVNSTLNRGEGAKIKLPTIQIPASEARQSTSGQGSARSTQGKPNTQHPMYPQFAALGYEPGETIHFQALIPKNTPSDYALKRGMLYPITGYLLPNGHFVVSSKVEGVREPDQAYPDGQGYLNELNRRGYGIYFRVNPGGVIDEDITHCRNLFYECDKVSKDEQWQRVESLRRQGFTPSLVVETRNSLHVYYRITENGVEDWRELQQRLIQCQDSDQSIHNEARLMRVAGFNHWKWTGEKLEATPVTIQELNPVIYSRGDFDLILPQWDKSRWVVKTEDKEPVAITAPSENPWDIRNFANYFEGYQQWDSSHHRAKCPHHSGVSNNSLSINVQTGQFHCFGGCSSKDIYRSGLELAKSQGYQVPESSPKKNWFNPFQIWGKLFKSREEKSNQRLRKYSFEPGEPPTKVKAPATGDVFEYEEGERLKTWQDAQANGYRYILDSSAPGAGKSYDTGNVNLPDFPGIERIEYTTDGNHRTPTTDTLGEGNGWKDNEPRHDGLTYRVQPDGSKKLVRAKPGDVLAVEPNCIRMDTITALRAKNIQGADQADLICGGCHRREFCSHGGGFLSEKQAALKAEKLRTAVASRPDPKDYDRSKTLEIRDDQGINFMHTLDVNLGDVDQAIATLATGKPDQFEKLAPTLTKLRGLLGADPDRKSVLGRWGIGHAEVLKHLPIPILTDEDWAGLEHILKPDLSFLNRSSAYGVEIQDLPQSVRKKFYVKDSDSAKLAETLPKQWLIDFLKVLTGKQLGGIAIGYGGLTLTQLDERDRNQIKANALTIFLDGTKAKGELARELGGTESEIFHCRQRETIPENLKVFQVPDMGAMGRQRGNNQEQRFEALVSELRKTKEVKVIDFKGNKADGDWWVHSRGSNAFTSTQCLILVGSPCPNLLALEAEFTLLYGRVPIAGTVEVEREILTTNPELQGKRVKRVCTESNDPEFREFVRGKILAEINQGIRRLRANRRPGEELEVYIISDFALDFPVEIKKAVQICPEAGSKLERMKLAIARAVKDLIEQGKKVTQAAVAEIVGKSQQYISKFRKLLLLLVSFYSKSSKNFDAQELERILSVEDKAEIEVSAQALETIASSTDPPPKKFREVLDVAEWVQNQNWPYVWGSLTAKTQDFIISLLLLGLPDWELQNFRESLT